MDPWCRGREVARGVLRSSPKPEKRPIFCHRRGIEIFCRLFSTQQRPNVFVSEAWPAPATDHRSFCEHCDQRVGRNPNKRVPFRFHGAVVGFVDRRLSRTRNLAALNKQLAEFFSGRSWAKIGPGIIFCFFFEKFDFFFRRFVLIASGTEIFWRVSFEIQTFYGNIAFPLSPVSCLRCSLAYLFKV